MNEMKESTQVLFKELFERYPCLEGQSEPIWQAFELIKNCFEQDHRLFICGNGGSAADAQHIVGELMKSFTQKRAIAGPLARSLREQFPDDAACLTENLQGALPAQSLVNETALMTAYMNDVSPDMIFAQQLSGLMRRDDVLIALTTSGRSKNILNAVKVARALGGRVLALTGENSGAIAPLCQVTIAVPEAETYKIQELHLPVYHTLCLMLENELF